MAKKITPAVPEAYPEEIRRALKALLVLEPTYYESASDLVGKSGFEGNCLRVTVLLEGLKPLLECGANDSAAPDVSELSRDQVATLLLMVEQEVPDGVKNGPGWQRFQQLAGALQGVLGTVEGQCAEVSHG